MKTLDISNKVVYQIYPKSFKDSNGDGWGDLRGVTQKLDYLAELGVDYIWLTPFFPSPQRDNGYDVADYRAVDPRYGTIADFEELACEARSRGIGIMLDMVLNHTSTDHEWYRRALAGEKRYQDYYFFRDGDPDKLPTNWTSKFGGPTWLWEPAVGKWRLHLFDPTQADLDWSNPEVCHEVSDIVRFWKEKGVSGFRFDVVNLISKPEVFEDDHEGDGRRFYTDGPHVHEYLQELVREAGIDGMMTVGEMSSTTLDACLGYTRPEDRELSMAFSFHHLKVDYKNGNKWELMPADLGELRRILSTWQEGMQADGGWNALFWDNHDQPRVVSRFGSDGELRVPSAKMLCLFMNLLRGTPYIYQGNELGMTKRTSRRSTSTATWRASTTTESSPRRRERSPPRRCASSRSAPATTRARPCSGTRARTRASRRASPGARRHATPRAATSAPSAPRRTARRSTGMPARCSWSRTSLPRRRAPASGRSCSPRTAASPTSRTCAPTRARRFSASKK